jgi:hypothetical protein
MIARGFRFLAITCRKPGRALSYGFAREVVWHEITVVVDFDQKDAGGVAFT